MCVQQYINWDIKRAVTWQVCLNCTQASDQIWNDELLINVNLKIHQMLFLKPTKNCLTKQFENRNITASGSAGCKWTGRCPVCTFVNSVFTKGELCKSSVAQPLDTVHISQVLTFTTQVQSLMPNAACCSHQTNFFSQCFYVFHIYLSSSVAYW